MRGSRCGLLVLAMVMMVAALSRAQTAQQGAAEQIRGDGASTNFVRALGLGCHQRVSTKARWCGRGLRRVRLRERFRFPRWHARRE